uniref:Copper transport protein n=1 Tax=Wollemia nobilis TaxID=56998 RepID=A0A0C9S7Z3_9CONI
MGPGMHMTPPHNSTEQKRMSEGMQMHMALYWGKTVDLMFSGWSSKTVTQYVLSLAALFVLAFFHQTLSYMRTLYFQPDERRENQKGAARFGTKSMVTSILETVAFACNAATGYLLMLAVMSYNVGVFLVILAGLSVGFFFVCVRKKAAAPNAASAVTAPQPAPA